MLHDNQQYVFQQSFDHIDVNLEALDIHILYALNAWYLNCKLVSISNIAFRLHKPSYGLKHHLFPFGAVWGGFDHWLF